MFEVLSPGVLSTFQDPGRRGHEAYGIPRSGALDPFLMSVANRLVGNPLDTTVIEFAIAGPSLLFHKSAIISIAGFGCRFTVDDKPVAELSAHRVAAGAVLKFANMEGWFGYIGIAGGFETPKYLGSASTYVAGKLGKKLEKGDRFEMRAFSDQMYSIKQHELGFRRTNIITILPAIHTSLFSEKEQYKIVQNEFTIRSNSDRMGIQLEGAKIDTPRVKRSAPAIPGIIQIARSGDPIILGPEGPTTGGYPQIAVISRVGWTTIAKTRPNQPIRFEWIEVESARQIWEYRNAVLKTEDLWERI